jgi:hypothetical protein
VTGVRLYIRSRHLLPAIAVVVGVNLAGIMIGNAEFHPTEDSAFGIPWLLFLPVVPAVAATLSLRSPSATLDRVAARPLAGLRAAHLLVIVVPAIPGTILVNSVLAGPFGVMSGVRNLIGFTGLALLSAQLIEGRLCWLVPCGWSVAALTLGDPQSSLPVWDWPVRYDTDFDAFLVAVALLLAGTWTIVRGTRERQHEDQ